MQHRSVGRTLGVSRAIETPAARVVSRAPGVTAVEPRSRRMDVAPCEVGPVSVEYLVRGARVTDIDRFVALSAGSVKRMRPALDAAGLPQTPNEEERDRGGMPPRVDRHDQPRRAA